MFALNDPVTNALNRVSGMTATIYDDWVVAVSRSDVFVYIRDRQNVIQQIWQFPYP